MVQRQRLERGQGPKSPFRQEPEPVFVQVDGGRLTGELLGQLGQAGAVAQDAAALLLSAGAGCRTGPSAGPPGQHGLGQQAQHGDWKEEGGMLRTFH